ncbi:MAG: glutamate--tRNA ligase family protein, partial [bacterium]
TPKHIILYQALGWQIPEFAHIPLILNPNKSKMSKRKDGDLVWLSSYRKQGYLPEAIINYLALLGWGEGGDREEYSLQELIERFDLSRVHSAGAVFDIKKLQAFNSRYIKKLSDQEYLKWCKQFLLDIEADDEIILRYCNLVKERLACFNELTSLVSFLFNAPDPVDPSLYVGADKAQARTFLTYLRDDASWRFTTRTEWFADTDRFLQEHQLTRQQTLGLLRASLTGLNQSPDALEIALVLGKEETLKRYQAVCQMLA